MKVAVIGCGAVARRAHIPLFQSIPDVQVTSVIDTDEDLARKVSKEFGIRKYYTDYKQALNEEELELVSICTPSFNHAEIVVESAKMGKHVLVEKPLALDVEQGKNALRAVKENKTQLCVVHNYRMAPSVQQIRRKIEQGKIGRIVSMVAVSHTPFPISWTTSTWLYHYGGALDDFGPHIFDLLLWMNPSTLESVSASGGDLDGNFGFITHIQVGMKFRDTSIAVADISWLNDFLVVNMDVYGTAGRLSCDIKGDYHSEIHGQMTSPIDEIALVTRKTIHTARSVISGRFFRGGIQYHSDLIKKYIKSIQQKTPPPVSGEEALVVTAVSEAAKRSLRTGKTIFMTDIL